MTSRRKRLSGALGYATLACSRFQQLADTAKDESTRVHALEQLARWTARLANIKNELNGS